MKIRLAVLHSEVGRFPTCDETLGQVMGEQMSPPFELLLGRKTYELFADHWPKQSSDNPAAGALNKAKKYVVSHKPLAMEWENTELVTGDIPTRLKDLKAQDGPILQVHGSSNLIQTLLVLDLIDELWLKIFPVTIGTGKRLFGERHEACSVPTYKFQNLAKRCYRCVVSACRER